MNSDASDSQSEDSSSSASDAEFSPVARQKKRPAKNSGGQNQRPAKVNAQKKKDSNPDDADDADQDGIIAWSIYDVVSGDHHNQQQSMEACVVDWLDQYRQDHVQGVLALLNFMLQSTGCPEGMQADDVQQGQEYATDVLADLHQRYVDVRVSLLSIICIY